MKLDIPALADAADTLELIRRDGVRVTHVHFIAPPVVAALRLVGFGLFALAFAVVLSADNGSKVAGQKGGRRGR